jgi:hypothetical protein
MHCAFLAAGLAATLALGAVPAGASQIAKEEKQAATAGQPSPGVSSSWHILLVASDAVRAYRGSIFINHVDFGKALVAEAEKVFGETFASVRTVSALPTTPDGYQGIDLVVELEVPHGEIHMAMFSNPMTLTETFVVRNAKGAELCRLQETANDDAKNLNHGRDRLGEAVSRQFVNDLLSNALVRNALAPAAPAPEAKAELADTAVMDSAGLEVPPPPPWRAASKQIAPGRP